jgi:type I restriction enzyme S subunit
MKSSYRKLGSYIQVVNKRDKDKTVDKLLGVSIRKVLIPSIANIIGTDMSTYKIIQKNQFAYGPVTSRNGDKISVAILEDYDEAIVSQAYTVFEVIDEKKLLPEYLMMWFRRPEFDRYARFKSHGSAREIFGWDEMCDTELPITSPEKQQEIVREYNIIENRIALNNQLISKLEETAQAIYKQWFVDFEFPDLNGKPYKSNGGVMVWCEELEKEIPEDWEVRPIGEIIETIGGGTPSTDEDEFWVNGDILWYSPTDVTKSNSIFSSITERKITKNGLQRSAAKMFPSYSLLMTSRATVGKLTINTKAACTNQGFITLIPTENISVYLLFDWIKTQLEEITSLATGSTFPEISKADFRNLKFIYPNEDILMKYSSPISHIYKTVQFRNEENLKLEELKVLLLAKMTKVETKNVEL